MSTNGTTTDITPPRCHWCGGETEICGWNRALYVGCQRHTCQADGPCRSTPAEAVAAYKAVAPTLRWTSEPPKVAGLYVIRWWPFSQPTLQKITADDIARKALWTQRFARLGPIPEPIDESEAAK